MIKRQSGGGARQHAWDKLDGTDWISVEALAADIGCTAGGLRQYIAALAERGYIERTEEGYLHLALRTGPRAPSFSVHTGEFRDWNLDPALSPEQLQALVRATGLSDSAWLEKAGMSAGGATRLRQMMNGKRPVSAAVAEAAQRLAGSQ